MSGVSGCNLHFQGANKQKASGDKLAPYACWALIGTQQLKEQGNQSQPNGPDHICRGRMFGFQASKNTMYIEYCVCTKGYGQHVEH